MKTIKLSFAQILSVSIALLFIISINSSAQGNSGTLGFPDGYAKKKITTEMTGINTETTQEIYIAKNGYIIATYQTEKRTISMANIVDESQSVTIRVGSTVTTYDPITRKGTSTTIELADQFSNMSDEEMQQMAGQIEESTGTETEDIGTRDILGFTCNGIRATTSMMGMENVSEIWFYKNFIMESISTGMASVKEFVTEFILGSNYDQKMLEVPSDVEITVVTSPF